MIRDGQGSEDSRNLTRARWSNALLGIESDCRATFRQSSHAYVQFAPVGMGLECVLARHTVSAGIFCTVESLCFVFQVFRS
jgi:hypothetical protein